MFTSNNEILISKLDEFIRKFYKNLLVRGIIYSSAIFLVFFLTVALIENFGHFNSTVRTLLFYLFVFSNLIVFIRLIFIPLAKLFKLGSIISHEQAAHIIGEHFSEVQDKLLNVLQLQNIKSEIPNPQSAILIEASISQKIKELKPVPFASAINLSENKKYLKYAAIPLLILAFILVANKNIITGSTARIIKHSEYFEKPQPFSFSVLNEKLEAIQQEDFELEVRISGSVIPDAAFIEIEGNQYRLEKSNIVSFHYLFKNIQKNISFRLTGDGVFSKKFELVALPNPVMLSFETKLDYPAYLNKAAEETHNTGDLTLPEGTKVSWNFSTRNTDQVKISFMDTTVQANRQGESKYVFSKYFYRNSSYTVSTSNRFLKNKDSISYSVNIIPDQYPAIEIEQDSDGVNLQQLYFKGIVRDDYGFSKLAFRWRYMNKKDVTDETPIQEIQIPIVKNNPQQTFFHKWDVTLSVVEPGDEIEYFFEVWDNDGVNGAKSSRSTPHVFKAPTLKEIAENTQKKNDEIKAMMRESMNDAKALQKEISDLEKKLAEKKSLGWEDKKKAEDLLKRQKELQKKVENTQQENEKNVKQQSQYKEQNQEIAQKHNELKKLMDELMTEEMKKMMQELEKLLAQTDKQKVQDQLEKMKLSNKDLEKELDRTLELFKELEVEQKLKEAIKDLQQLAEKQDKLSQESLEKKTDSKSIEKKQDDFNKEFQDLKKDIKDLEQKNQALDDPKELKNTEEQQKSIDQDMQDGKQQLGQNKKQGASKSQKQAAEKMDDMAQKMEKGQEEDEEQQDEEDMDALRALLENLLRLSFDQEKLMNDLTTIYPGNPQYLKLGQQQRKLKDDARMIEDSLFALSKRVSQIQSIVNREIASVNDNMEKAIDFFQDRDVPQLRARQQMTMTSVNNLALLLSEALEDLQKQMRDQQQSQASKSKSKSKSQCKKPGSAACNKPGKGKPSSAAQMKKMQEAINKQMGELQKALKEGKKPGNNQVPGQQGMSEQLARMAAQQEMLREELQRFNQENNKDGKNTLGNLAKTAKEMEKTETDLVNKMITNETMKRQEEILTRLLEAEKAERERDQDNKRESKEGKEEFNRNPDEFAAYKKLKEKETELFKTVPPSLSPYYKKKVDDYFRNIEDRN